ncbi:thiamine pyrophosphate-dependent dehydrogenase E1 component subunit alpha [uncultured Tessaracoccus sp.]|uniref:thiamine pyrophosphate-dependent dehydrogenase E1 component subunit alpha n=1 Tax=uncultured Tessaracoccus sp. TaxID=905023 RepID=UPI0025FC272B|nr:thiamine pyrophosphate-dependent dehydrogenase E1 component subunit alpha [uncultured Tessaracoccus sp.]
MPDDMVQLLAPDGTRAEHPDFRWDGTPDDLRASLRDMWLGRRFDQEATALQRHGELGLWPPQLGQEAAQIGAARAIGARDHVFPSYREHAMALALGLPPAQLLAFFRGCDAGRWDLAHRFHTYTLVIGAQTLHAVGYAMGLQLDARARGDDAPGAAVMGFHGDGATAQGDVHEAYVFAASHDAPVVFLCQNNQWAISEPTRLQSRVPLHERARGYGFPGIRVDGNDVLAVEAVTSWAMARARRGEGPTLVEAWTYRMGAHTTSDDPTRYRSADEEAHWRRRDPIDRLVAHLRATDEVDDAWLDRLDEEASDLGATTRAAIATLTDVDVEELFDLVHAEPTDELARQRGEHAAHLRTLEEAR